MQRSNPIFSENFIGLYRKSDGQARRRLDKVIEKVLKEPGLGKPLRNRMAGFRSERFGSFRITYEIGGDFVIFHDVDHRKNVYR